MSTRAWVTFGAVSVLWGIPYLFIKVAVDVPPPELPQAETPRATTTAARHKERFGSLLSTVENTGSAPVSDRGWFN